MQFAPDGRLFVAEQGGRLRVVKNGVLLPTPFVMLSVNASGERGLLGIAFDPNFAVNGFVYLYYTTSTPTVHNRISRFTANGDVAVPGSEVVILDLDNLSSATNHNGGAMGFGPDGKLYAAVGENAAPANAQSLNNLLGKMLRINRDGTIPTDNPFYASTTGRNRAIWALGLRNPFTFAFNAAGVELFINDVGQSSWEEINDGRAGANYGWPDTEGATTDPVFVTPRYAYSHASGRCAITGGAFYSPLSPQFPPDYDRDYFFADYCAGWIRKLDPANGNAVTSFASGISAPVDLKVSDDGALYYLARGAGAIYRIDYGASAPSITSHPANRTAPYGASVTFSVRASGTGPLRFQWHRNGAPIPGATAADHTIASVAAGDNGARFRAVVSNDAGNATSNEALLTVSANRPPTGAITQPAAGTTYSGGMTINYAGTGTDQEDGALGGAAFTWQVDFHHDTHSHPFIPPTSGATGGSFTIARTGEVSANVWYRIRLTVVDSAGLAHMSTRDVLPRKATLTLASNPSGLLVRLDGQPVVTPHSFQSVVGVLRNIEAVSAQAAAGTSYQFAQWSDGGPRVHDVATPSAATTYTAAFTTISTGNGTGLPGTYFNNLDFTGTTVSRIDPVVDFRWGTASPAAGIEAETFSVRWSGAVEAPLTGSYTFYTQSDDGVRLTVNGRAIVNNWTDHKLTENQGTISLLGGVRYPIVLEYYDKGGSATARLLWSTTAMPKAVVPASRLYSDAPPSLIRINFQPPTAPVPAGYLRDSGATYGDRGNGQSYGWTIDHAAHTRDRNAAHSPDQRYDTLTYMQRADPDARWELALANGTYRVRIAAGDPAYYGDNTMSIVAEGTIAISGTTTVDRRWIEGTVTVAVTDGRLTIRNGPGAVINKICFVEISR
jgi:glucose/arabinose dehydrogenase